jgi:hypothetical protein
VCVMRGRRAAWMIALPLAVASWLGAHCLAYWLVAPAGEHEMGVHAESGHAYLGYTPAILIWGLALVVAGLLLCVGYGLRGHRPSPPPLRGCALVPPVGFTVQEHLERLIGTGGVPPDIVLEPTFLVGLALQLPLTLAALLLAHALNGAGFTLGAMLAPKLAPEWPHRVTPDSPQRLPAAATLIGPPVLALGHGPRAPPSAACS